MSSQNRHPNSSPAYEAAGVDIDAGNRLVQRIAPLCQDTYRSGVFTLPNGFAGLFDLGAAGYQNPLLVSAADGVGSKIKLAWQLNKHDTIGRDLVAMCANDILCCGAEPIVFLDYFACGTLSVDLAETVIAGIAEGCKQAGCALIGGETAEMPGIHNHHEYELAGFALGLVEKSKRCGAHKVQPGDKILGIASSGLHANGYSLLRAIIDRHPEALEEAVPQTDKNLAQLAMEPTLIYVSALLKPLKEEKIHALAHITGGGIVENLPRILPDGMQACLRAWPWPPIFSYLQKKGNIDKEEMLRVFNCGIGMAAVVADEQHLELAAQLNRQGCHTRLIGEVVKQNGKPSVFFQT